MEEISNLKLIRERSGLSQSELSSLLGIPKRTIENYETGSRVPPNWVMDLLCEHIINHTLKSEIVYDKNHGVYSLLELRNILEECLKDFDVEYVLITGDYFEGNAKVGSELSFVIFGNEDHNKIVKALEKATHKVVNVSFFDLRTLDKKNLSELERRGLRIYTKYTKNK